MKDNPYFEIGNSELLISIALMIIVLILNRIGKMKLGKDIVIGTIRCFLQLMMVGYILKTLFTADNWYWVALTITVMILIAGFEAVRREEKKGPRTILYVTGAITVATILVMLCGIYLIVGIKPWYNPQYVIPMMGMLVGNAMTGASLLVNRLRAEIAANKDVIEAKLSLGADCEEAVKESVTTSIRAAMIPTINSLMIVGLVSLPGMMTGQIIAGMSPLSAVKYQIAIMYMIASSTALTIFAAAHLGFRQYFTKEHQVKEELL